MTILRKKSELSNDLSSVILYMSLKFCAVILIIILHHATHNARKNVVNRFTTGMNRKKEIAFEGGGFRKVVFSKQKAIGQMLISLITGIIFVILRSIYNTYNNFSVVGLSEFIDNLDVTMILKIPGFLIKVTTFSILMFRLYRCCWGSAFLVIKKTLKTFIETLFNLVSYETKKYQDESL